MYSNYSCDFNDFFYWILNILTLSSGMICGFSDRRFTTRVMTFGVVSMAAIINLTNNSIIYSFVHSNLSLSFSGPSFCIDDNRSSYISMDELFFYFLPLLDDVFHLIRQALPFLQIQAKITIYRMKSHFMILFWPL